MSAKAAKKLGFREGRGYLLATSIIPGMNRKLLSRQNAGPTI